MQLSGVRRAANKDAWSTQKTVRSYLEHTLTEYNVFYAIADKTEKTQVKNATKEKSEFFK